MFFAPRQGLLARFVHRALLSIKIAQDHMLLTMVRTAEVDSEYRSMSSQLLEQASVNSVVARIALNRLRSREFLQNTVTGLRLTEEGRKKGLRLLRSHRLWETYLNELGLQSDHVHEPADILEHYIDEQLQREIDDQVPDREFDPQGKEIPPTS